MTTEVRWLTVAAVGLFVSGFAACSPGYMKVQVLDQLEQGPKECAERCTELGMKMGALVLMPNEAGCVCEPLPAPDPSKAVSQDGASAAVAGEVVIAAAGATAEQLRQQSHKSPTHP